MDERVPPKIKRAGNIVFLLVVIIFVGKALTYHSRDIPQQIYGCYYSGVAPAINIDAGEIHVAQDGIGTVASTYVVDSHGQEILTSEPLLLKPSAGGHYEFIKDRAGRYIEWSPGPPTGLEIRAADGVVISYSRVKCGAR